MAPPLWYAKTRTRTKCARSIVCLALDLYFKGSSFRKIADALGQFFGVSVEHSMIIRWVQKTRAGI